MATTVLAAFDECLRRLALTDDQVQIASTRHQALRDFLQTRFELVGDAWLTGSYSRQTIVRLDRDIDIMAVFSVPEYWSTYEYDSSGFVRMVRDVIKRDHYPNSDVTTSGGAIVMKMSVFNVDLAPVFKRKDGGYLFANGAGRWKATNPPYHFDLMKERNKADPALKPLVKLVKFWNIANGLPLESFHIEMMVEQMWRGGTADSYTYPFVMTRTMEALPDWVRREAWDPWSPGGRIDMYLTGDDREKAYWRAVTDAGNARAAEDLGNAGRESEAIAKWRHVFLSNDAFPAYG